MDKKIDVTIKKVSSNEPNVSKRHTSYDVYHNGKYHTTFNDINDAMDHKEKMHKEEIELDEVLSIQQREKRRQIIRRYETKIERARELARKKMAPEKNIKKRAYAQARQIVRKRVAGQRGAEYEKLGPSEKMAIDRAVETKTKLIKKLAARLIPRVKQAEQQRLAAFMKGQALTNNGQPEGNSKVNEQFNEIFNEAFPPYDTAGVMGRSVDSPVVGNRMASKVGNKTSKDDKDLKGKNTPIIQYGKFGENLEVDSPEFRALAKKADKSDIDLEILGEVYNRGLDAWTENLNVSQQQYAFARVNSYINQGRTYFNEDADLHENYLDGKGPGKPGDAERHGLTGKSAAELRKIRSSKTASPRTKQLAHWMLNMHHNEDVNEATYQGREVPLNKPMPGDVKKSKVYVDPDGDGKAQKVNFGSKELSIKKHIPARKKSYCARSGGQGNLTDKTSANYWSRKAWNCEETEIEEVKAQPYVEPLHNESGKHVGWKSSNGHHVKYWQLFAKKSAEKHAGINEAAGESILPPSPSASSKKRMSVQSVERDSTPMTPSNNADLPTSPKSSYNKETQIKKKILEAGNKQNDPKKRLQGTDSLVKAYVTDTPCMSVNESFNIAFASGIGVTLTSKDHGMQIQGGFALHPSVIDQMDEMERQRLEQEFEEEVEPADRKPVVVRAHKDAYGNTIPAKTYFRKRTTPIVNADDNPNDGQ